MVLGIFSSSMILWTKRLDFIVGTLGIRAGKHKSCSCSNLCVPVLPRHLVIVYYIGVTSLQQHGPSSCSHLVAVARDTLVERHKHIEIYIHNFDISLLPFPPNGCCNLAATYWEFLLTRYFQALDALLDISGMGWCISNAEENSTHSPDIFPGYGLYEENSTARIEQSPCQVE